MKTQKNPKLRFAFIVSQGKAVFDVTIFANDEKMAREKLKKTLMGDFSFKIRNIEERE